jgi:hypothetical protein
VSTAVDGNESPYIGPRPFQRGDRMFFGRDREVRELVSLVVAHRIVVLYAASGAGKTSLLNAGLLPALEQEESFEVLPVARLRPFDPAIATKPELRNVYTFGVTSNWSRELDGIDDAVPVSLAAALARREHPTDAQGFASPRAVVFDQFEELFSLFPERWPDRAEFLEEVADALEQDPLLRVVFALREDYLAQLDSHASLLPGNLRTRLRIERLGPDAAQEAVTRPLLSTPRAFAPGVAEKLVADLRTIRVDSALGGDVEVEGEFVEPVHLQVACQSLWSELPPKVTTITEDHLRTFGNVDEVLSRFYDGAVHDAADAAGIREGRLRASLEAAFLTAGGTRGTVYRGASSTAGISNRAIDELENLHLLRAEWRAGARWYELTHDRLIEPIQASNRAFTAAAVRRRNRRVITTSAGFAVLGAVGLTVALGSSTLSTPSAGPAQRVVLIGADFGSAALDSNISRSEYLDQSRLPRARYTTRELRRGGVLATYTVTLRGGKGTSGFPLDAVIKNRQNKIVSRLAMETLRAHADLARRSGEVWVPTPRKAGLYRLSLQVFAPGPERVSLDTITTERFAGTGGKGSRTRRVRFRVLTRGAGRGVVTSPSGVSCPPRCTIKVASGSRVTLTAFPARGSAFVGWRAACPAQPTCTVVAGRITGVVAFFSPR